MWTKRSAMIAITNARIATLIKEKGAPSCKNPQTFSMKSRLPLSFVQKLESLDETLRRPREDARNARARFGEMRLRNASDRLQMASVRWCPSKRRWTNVERGS